MACIRPGLATRHAEACMARRPCRRHDILSYLDTIGTRQDAFVARSRAVGWNPLPAEAFLYDLGDSARLRTATADSFPLVDPFLGEGPLGCGQGPLAMASAQAR